ncbi:hypothetical protein cypCar_00049564 [Cyprinus carpio]|nr:hypothetical protein cypCar_00049564 [Cyprinus carpio]
MHAQREVELVNRCFADVEHFMARLQETAEAKNILEQQSIKKNSKKNKKKSKKKQQDDGPLTQRVTPPSEQEFVDIFQKIKYSVCLLDRLKMKISEPTAEELLHHVFIPLQLVRRTEVKFFQKLRKEFVIAIWCTVYGLLYVHQMVKTTGGPELAATVSSPAMTSGAISLLQQNLNEQEKQLWNSLGSNWTMPKSVTKL